MTPRHSRRPLAALLVVCLVAGAVTPAAVVATNAVQPDDPTVTVTDATVDVGNRATVEVGLDAVPDGLAGFELTLTADGPAAVVDASYPDTYQPTTTPQVATDGGSVTLEAGDLSDAVQSGDGPVALATVTVEGVEPGTTTLSATEVSADGDDGSRIDPATASGTVTVGTETTVTDAQSDTTTADGTATEVPDETIETTTAGGETDDTDTESGPETTSANGPLAPVLVVLAVGLLAVGALARRG